MSTFWNFFTSSHVMALLMATLVFFTTIFLVAKRWIGFPMAMLLLVFSLIVGLIINYQQTVDSYLKTDHALSLAATNETPEVFQKQIVQAIENLQLEVQTEKENMRQVMSQVQEIFEQMDVQKQKLQSYIEETREHFQNTYIPQKEGENSSAPSS